MKVATTESDANGFANVELSTVALSIIKFANHKWFMVNLSIDMHERI
jgi:hypothetical protein